MFNKIIFCFLLIGILYPLETMAFLDVSKKNQYYKAIHQLKKDGVINGYADNNFLPEKIINRAEFLKIAINIKLKQKEDLISGEDKRKYQNCFQDVQEEWFAIFVCYAKSQQWVQGYENGTFQPEKAINFGEAFAMLGKIFELDVSSFNQKNWYYPYQRYFNLFDLVGNIEESIDFQVNRGEMANLVYLLIQHLDKNSIEERINKIKKMQKLETYKIEVMNLVNQVREKEGKSRLIYSIQLENTAQMHAEDMQKREFFAHINPDGVDVLTRVKKFKYDQRDVGENIAQGQSTPEEVMLSWLNSKPHRENLLKTNFTEMGVGIYADGSEGFYWVQVFGKQCEERDNVVGCISRAEYQTRNIEEWSSPYTWY